MVLYKKILLADDDEDDQHLFAAALNEIDKSIECEFTLNGSKTLQALKRATQLPDVVFLDLNMPYMNGFECLRRIKKDIRLSALPIVIFTTSKNPEDAEAAHRLGANVYFSKPADSIELKEKLKRILSFTFQPLDPKMNVVMQYAV
jgi:CheY-like chemotaxis protein